MLDWIDKVKWLTSIWSLSDLEIQLGGQLTSKPWHFSSRQLEHNPLVVAIEQSKPKEMKMKNKVVDNFIVL